MISHGRDVINFDINPEFCSMEAKEQLYRSTATLPPTSEVLN